MRPSASIPSFAFRRWRIDRRHVPAITHREPWERGEHKLRQRVRCSPVDPAAPFLGNGERSRCSPLFLITGPKNLLNSVCSPCSQRSHATPVAMKNYGQDRIVKLDKIGDSGVSKGLFGLTLADQFSPSFPPVPMLTLSPPGRLAPRMIE